MNYFRANFPGSPFGVAVSAPTITVVDTGVHVRQVTVSATATLPLTFLKFLGKKTFSIGTLGQASRRDTNVILLLDRSGSMNNGDACGALISSSINFVNQLSEGRDEVGLVTFESGAHYDFTPSTTFKTKVTALLKSMVCGGGTTTHMGLYYAHQQLMSIKQVGTLNVVLLFTDGHPNGFYAKFPVKRSADKRYDSDAGTTVVNVPASSCSGNSAWFPLGTAGDASSEPATGTYGFNKTGFTNGVGNLVDFAINQTRYGTPLLPVTGCAFLKSSLRAREDIAYLPEKDAYNIPISTFISPLDRFTSGPYKGKVRPDVPRTGAWVALNAADANALAIRNDTTYNPVIYTIGLSGNEAAVMDVDFMRRMANDPLASNYNPQKAAGRFVLANNASELSQAFQQIASMILRISR